jgi:hypothetical protein
MFIGVAGVGGVIYDLEGHIELYFAWNIGKASNNQVEAYALLPGLLGISRKPPIIKLKCMHYYKD